MVIHRLIHGNASHNTIYPPMDQRLHRVDVMMVKTSQYILTELCGCWTFGASLILSFSLSCNSDCEMSTISCGQKQL